jgi:hypothetical protein
LEKAKFLKEQLRNSFNPATFAKKSARKFLENKMITSILDLNQEKEENN